MYVCAHVYGYVYVHVYVCIELYTMYEHVYATVDGSIASALQAAARSGGFIARDLCTGQRGDGEPAMKRLVAVASPDPDVANPRADVAGPGADVAGPGADVAGPGADVASPGAGVGHDVAPAGGGGCFELYGFDVLVDEASASPSRATCAHYRVRSRPRITIVSSRLCWLCASTTRPANVTAARSSGGCVSLPVGAPCCRS